MSVAKDFLIPDKSVCTPFTRIEDIKKMMEEAGKDEVVVVDTMAERHLIGRINGNTISKVSVDLSLLPSQINAEQCIFPFTRTVEEETPIESCLATMESEGLEKVPVVDRQGHYLGFINRNDLHKEEL